MGRGEYTGALTLLDPLVNEGFDEPLIADALRDEATYYRGACRAALGRLAEAEEDARRLKPPRSSLFPPEHGHLLTALIKLWQGQREALSDYEQALAQAREGLASNVRSAQVLAQRAWAWLYFDEIDKAREDFQAALAADGVSMFMDFLVAHKPFWRAVVEEALPFFAAGKKEEGLKRIDAIVERQRLHARAWLSKYSQNKIEADGAAQILVFEIQGGVAALRAKVAKEKRLAEVRQMQEKLAQAQQALLANDPRAAFDLYVSAFRDASDADGRDKALAGIASIVPLLPERPVVGEEVRRLLIKAKVALDAKDYAAAIDLYFQAYREAPWFAQLYYDRALLIGERARKAAEFDLAIREMRRFLLLAKGAPETRDAQDKIYEWEAQKERLKDTLPEVTPRARGVSATAAGSEDCFIATAAYGSPWEPHVASLRVFRDHVLLTNAPGRWLVARYYEFSPPLADYIREREPLRALVRGLLTPVVFIIEQPLAALAILVALVGGVVTCRRCRA